MLFTGRHESRRARSAATGQKMPTFEGLRLRSRLHALRGRAGRRQCARLMRGRQAGFFHALPERYQVGIQVGMTMPSHQAAARLILVESLPVECALFYHDALAALPISRLAFELHRARRIRLHGVDIYARPESPAAAEGRGLRVEVSAGSATRRCASSRSRVDFHASSSRSARFINSDFATPPGSREVRAAASPRSSCFFARGREAASDGFFAYDTKEPRGCVGLAQTGIRARAKCVLRCALGEFHFMLPPRAYLSPLAASFDAILARRFLMAAASALLPMPDVSLGVAAPRAEETPSLPRYILAFDMHWRRSLVSRVYRHTARPRRRWLFAVDDATPPTFLKSFRLRWPAGGHLPYKVETADSAALPKPGGAIAG